MPPSNYPSAERVERSRMSEFMRWLESERGLSFGDYHELQAWSVGDLDGFWSAIWEFFDVQADGDPAVVLRSHEMPGAAWFPNTALNYAERVFAGGQDGAASVIFHRSELRDTAQLTSGQLREQVAAFAAALRSMGVGRGDRVVAYMPNIVETIVAFLASASIGVVWSACSPDFGAESVVDRFAQIEPTVLLAVDGYRYGGKDFDRIDVVGELQRSIPSLRETVVLPYLDPSVDLNRLRSAKAWDEVLRPHAGAVLEFERVPFDHPLWVLYSSGTTGLPKAIVQSHGGILLEHLKLLNFHVDAQPGDRLFWFTTTGWMMWNFLVSGLLTPAAIVLYDGSPGYPDIHALWDLAAETEVSMFGTSASYISACMKAGVEPGAGRDLSSLRTVGSTGSPLAPEGFDWVYDTIGKGTWLFSTSGGTDVCTSFVGGVPVLPVYRGELQAPALGASVKAFDEDGKSIIGGVGELVVTEPMPSMPIYFWDDEDGNRYRESYFELFPGVWRHGDWLEITERGSGIIYGRSDSTINRGGIRMGTSEIYRAVLSQEEILDAVVIDVPRPGTEGWIALFVVLCEDATLSAKMKAEIARLVRRRCSPRHVPDEVLQIDEVPRTLSGKVLEVPVKRILMGSPVEKAVSRDALANPDALDYFVAMARELRGTVDRDGSPGELSKRSSAAMSGAQ
jgi:acetoacetyl-CoA synthetase